MEVTHLKFQYYDPHSLDLASSDGIKTHEFQLGLGPCGRWVTAMEVHIDLATVRVVQTAYDEDYAAAEIAANTHKEMLDAEWTTALGMRCPGSGELLRPPPGWDNLQYMTPTKAAWDRAYKKAGDELKRLRKLVPETKVFVYRLEDIRGRIAALCK